MEFDFSNYFWQGEKVRLRPYRATDWEAKYAEFIDSDNRRLLESEVGAPRTPEEYQRYYAEERSVEDDKGRLTFAIESLSGDFVGWCNMHARDSKNGTFGCALAIFPPFRRLGYAGDALRILLHYGFNELRYQKCNLGCLANNVGSIALQQKLGFVQEGLRRRVAFTGGQFLDECLLGITREEFLENERAAR